MSDIYLDHDTPEERLSAQLPNYMPKDPESGNYRLLSTLSERIESLRGNVEQIDRAASVQKADTIEQLDRLARLVNLKPYQGETKEHFRARIIAEFQLVSSEGTIEDLLNATSVILDTPTDKIGYTEYPDTFPGNCRLSVPLSKLESIEFTNSEFVDIVGRLIPSGYSIEIYLDGTFTYISEGDYTGGNFDTSAGYDSLDESGNPNDSGGTYAGILE